MARPSVKRLSLPCVLRWVSHAVVLFLVIRATSGALPTHLHGPDTFSDTVLHRIAFGSCNKHNLPQPLWRPILDAKPDLWVWLGDAVYADTRRAMFDWVPSPIGTMRAKYEAQLKQPEYAEFVQKMPVLGTWDDHDFGKNDGGADYEERALSQHLFLDFLGVPSDDRRREREGVFSSHVFGPRGRRVQLILLDVRYHRETPHDLNAPPHESERADILGHVQWEWLSRRLRDGDADVNIIASGIQVLTDTPVVEKWAQYPSAQKRLLSLIATSGARGVVLLSGDVHHGELLCQDVTSAVDGETVPLFEVTSSGLTHSCADQGMPWMCPFALHWLTPATHRVGQVFVAKNFGTIDIAWGSGESGVDVTAAVRDASGDSVLGVRVQFYGARTHSYSVLDAVDGGDATNWGHRRTAHCPPRREMGIVARAIATFGDLTYRTSPREVPRVAASIAIALVCTTLALVFGVRRLGALRK